MDNKKTYYQVSFTGAQALVGLVGLLAALAIAFFLGAKAGFEKSTSAGSPASSVVPPGESDTSASSPAPPTSTTIEPVPATKSASTPAAPSTSTGPVPPQEAPVFEDREAGVPGEKAPSRTEIAGETVRAPSAPAPTKAVPVKPVPSTAKQEPPASSAEKPAAGFYVQIVSTTSKGEATRWKEKLTAKKYRAALSAVDSSKGKMYRVRLGPYPDKEQAKQLAAKISTEFHKAAWVAPAQ
jgi:cell division septation protein DedD